MKRQWNGKQEISGTRATEKTGKNLGKGMSMGKVVEKNIALSLCMAGVRLHQDLTEDLHQKIDCTVYALGDRIIPGGLGLQISMKNNLVKARVSKLLALTARRYFMYLLVSDPGLFKAASWEVGQDLRRLLENQLPFVEKNVAVAQELGGSFRCRVL